MNAADIIEQIHSAGGTLQGMGDQLQLSAPEPLPAKLVETITAYKSELLRLLAANDVPPLLPEDERRIRAWLAHIEESDPDIVSEVLDRCRHDLNARAYFRHRSEEVPPPRLSVASPVTCGTCMHFQRNDHPHLGRCATGEPENPAGLWDTDRRHCTRWRRPT